MILVVGGTYNEYCFEPYWDEIFGSGLRGCSAILALDNAQKIQFHTFLDKSAVEHLNSFKQLYSNFDFKFGQIESTPTFSYDHPLSVPRIFPRPDSIDRSQNHLNVTGDNILYYGLLEGTASVAGKKVVYDPQSPSNPIPFSDTKSTADQLVVIVNSHEAEIICGSNRITDIKSFFLEKEKAEACIIKMGPKGALVCTKHNPDITIPVYKTPSVWSIGTGDTFASVFAFHWFKGMKLQEAAERASYATAEYSHTRVHIFSEFGSNPDLQKLMIHDHPAYQVYLAGPFFTFGERWLIDQFRTALQSLDLKVFSPFHDVGHGLARDVVDKDIEGIINSKLVLATLDGLDSGTLFEVGYAVARGIQVIGLAQKETSETLKMVEGTHCDIVDDFTTAVYKAYWALSETV